nr:MAG TPA: hypothetical protein [Caudoviricetes sp.]
MQHEEFMKLCARKVAEYENRRDDVDVEIDRDDVFCVWSCKTLQNSKCLMSAPHKGAKYYEFTHNGDRHEVYMDVYSKDINIPLAEDGIPITERIK